MLTASYFVFVSNRIAKQQV